MALAQLEEALDALNEESATEQDAVSSLETATVGPDEGRVDVLGEQRTLEVSVVLDGVGVADADVRVLDRNELEDLGVPDALYDIEASLWNHGQHLTTDGEGKVLITHDSPVLVTASTDAHFGFASFEGSESAATLELERNARLTVRVVDSLGKSLGDADAQGVCVRAYTRVDIPESDSMFGSNDMRQHSDHRLVGGECHFQNRWFGQTYSGAGEPQAAFAAGPDHWTKFSIDAVSISIPGAAEYEPGAASHDRFRRSRSGRDPRSGPS